MMMMMVMVAGEITPKIYQSIFITMEGLLGISIILSGTVTGIDLIGVWDFIGDILYIVIMVGDTRITITEDIMDIMGIITTHITGILIIIAIFHITEEEEIQIIM